MLAQAGTAFELLILFEALHEDIPLVLLVLLLVLEVQDLDELLLGELLADLVLN